MERKSCLQPNDNIGEREVRKWVRLQGAGGGGGGGG